MNTATLLAAYRPRVLTLSRLFTTHPPSSLQPTPPLIPPTHPSSQPPASQSLVTLSPATLNTYTDTSAPTPQDLTTASRPFLAGRSPAIIYSDPLFRHIPSLSPYPEVCFLGRSNVGKSSLLNALFNRPEARPAHVSVRPGRTRTINGFGIPLGGNSSSGSSSSSDYHVSAPLTSTLAAPAAETTAATTAAAAGSPPFQNDRWKSLGARAIVVVDLPGYGQGSRTEWGTEVLKFLTNRKQLRRTFVLIDAEHGIKDRDRQVLGLLSERGIVHQVVLSKVDKILFPGAKMPGPVAVSNRLWKLRGVRDAVIADLKGGETRRRPGLLEDVLCVSGEKELDGTSPVQGRIGIDALRFAVMSACGMI